MRKLVLVAAVLSLLAGLVPFAAVTNTAVPINPVQTAGDDGPHGG